jgi:hypothetical protein
VHTSGHAAQYRDVASYGNARGLHPSDIRLTARRTRSHPARYFGLAGEQGEECVQLHGRWSSGLTHIRCVGVTLSACGRCVQSGGHRCGLERPGQVHLRPWRLVAGSPYQPAVQRPGLAVRPVSSLSPPRQSSGEWRAEADDRRARLPSHTSWSMGVRSASLLPSPSLRCVAFRMSLLAPTLLSLLQSPPVQQAGLEVPPVSSLHSAPFSRLLSKQLLVIAGH